jgi:hypothetical protein
MIAAADKPVLKRRADIAKVRGQNRYYEAVDTGAQAGESGGLEVRSPPSSKQVPA